MDYYFVRSISWMFIPFIYSCWFVCPDNQLVFIIGKVVVCNPGQFKIPVRVYDLHNADHRKIQARNEHRMFRYSLFCSITTRHRRASTMESSSRKVKAGILSSSCVTTAFTVLTLEPDLKGLLLDLYTFLPMKDDSTLKSHSPSSLVKGFLYDRLFVSRSSKHRCFVLVIVISESLRPYSFYLLTEVA